MHSKVLNINKNASENMKDFFWTELAVITLFYVLEYTVHVV